MTKRAGTESLRFFNKKADKLLGLSFTKSVFGESTRLEISMEDGGPLKVCRWGPGDEATDAFVLTFRFFIQDNEEVVAFSGALRARNVGTVDSGMVWWLDRSGRRGAPRFGAVE